MVYGLCLFCVKNIFAIHLYMSNQSAKILGKFPSSNCTGYSVRI